MFKRCFIILCLLVAISCHVAYCVIVNIRRGKQDIFSNPPFKRNRTCNVETSREQCKMVNSAANSDTKLNGYCTCSCMRSFSAYLESIRGCANNRELRERQTNHNQWVYLLEQELTGADEPISVQDVVTMPHNVITFKINGDILTNYNYTFLYQRIHSCDPYTVEIINAEGKWDSVDSLIENKSIRTDNKVSNEYHTPLNIELNWKNETVTSQRLVGKVMRIKIYCTGQKFGKNVTADGFIIFKTKGEIRVVFPDTSTVVSSTTLLSTSPSAFLLTTDNTTPSLTYSDMSSETFSRTSTQTMTARLVSTTTTSTSYPTSSPSNNELPFHSTTSRASSSSSIAVVYHSTSLPDRSSSDNSAVKTVAGVVVGLIVSIVIALILLYIVRRRRLKRNDSGNQKAAKDTIQIPTMSNPVYEGNSYENPCDVQNGAERQSGIKSIQSALYDKCLMVENPSAVQKTPSVYDNVDGKKVDQTYQDLDPNKREPPSKYQSLVKPKENQYSTLPGKRDTDESVYTEPKNDGQQMAPVYTDPKHQPVYDVLEDGGEPVYNVLENDHPTELSNTERSGHYDNVA